MHINNKKNIDDTNNKKKHRCEVSFSSYKFSSIYILIYIGQINISHKIDKYQSTLYTPCQSNHVCVCVFETEWHEQYQDW